MLTPEKELCRDIMFSLKNAPILDPRLFQARHGVSPLESHAGTFSRLVGLDLVQVGTDAIRLTAKGRLVVEEIACLFALTRRRGSPARTRRDAALLRKHDFIPTYQAAGRPGGEPHGG